MPTVDCALHASVRSALTRSSEAVARRSGHVPRRGSTSGDGRLTVAVTRRPFGRRSRHGYGWTLLCGETVASCTVERQGGVVRGEVPLTLFVESTP